MEAGLGEAVDEEGVFEGVGDDEVLGFEVCQVGGKDFAGLVQALGHGIDGGLAGDEIAQDLDVGGHGRRR